MMGTARYLCRTLWVLALVAVVPATPATAQQTIQVASSTEVRALLRQAESLLATNNSQIAYELLLAQEAEMSGLAYFDYLLGVAALDTLRFDEAILSLQRSVSTAPQFSGARMELARAHFEAGEPDMARPMLVTLLTEDPPPGVRDVLDQYIAAIDAKSKKSKSRFKPYVELTVGHDDNANASTDDQQFLGFTLSPENLETDSYFYEAGAGFDWTTQRSARLAWQLGARVGYRKNPDAPFVDSTVLGGGGGLLWRRGAIFGRAQLDGYRSTRDGESNESYQGVNLQIGRHLSELWDLSFSLRAGALRHDDAIEILDVDRILYRLGTGYRFRSRGRIGIEVIGGSDNATQNNSPYGNSRFGARLSMNAPLGESSYVFISVGSLTSNFDSLFFGVPREDTQLTSVLQFEFRDVLTDGLTITPRVRYIHNASNVSLYDYDRTEIGLLLRWVPK
ncbi:MAG: tetratricopeptide repeat protein [Woeseiaceae bacterium]